MLILILQGLMQAMLILIGSDLPRSIIHRQRSSRIE